MHPDPDFKATEGYIYPVYGNLKYLKYALASVASIRRYDRNRPVAIICEPHHRDELNRLGLDQYFDKIHIIDPEHCSIVGFKHNFFRYMLFDKNMFLDTDMIFCRNPDPLWIALGAYQVTISGSLKADSFFGAPKHIGIMRDILFSRRRRTLKRFDLTYLSRVQSGLIYSRDKELSETLCNSASEILSEKSKTHFQNRTKESGRNEESCEWSLAMAMSRLQLPVYPWLNGHESPQLDYIGDYTEHDVDFYRVHCRFYTDPFMYNLRGLKSRFLRKILIMLISWIPGKADYMNVTPYILHFGWLHQKQPFIDFTERVWNNRDAYFKHP